MHVELSGDAATGYAAQIYDGGTFVTSRGMTGSADITVQYGNGAPAGLLNRYHDVSYSGSTATLTLSGATDEAGAATVTRWESYRFLPTGEIDARVGVSSTAPVSLWYSPYADFSATMHPLWLGGATQDYESPAPPGAPAGQTDSPLPVIGVSDGSRTYGLASGATWDYPLPGYSTPHLVIDGRRLAAPQIGTSADPVTLAAGQSRSWETVIFRGGPGSYGLALGGEVAMAHALGFNTKNSPGVPPTTVAAAGAGVPPALEHAAMADFGLIARATAYWARLTTAAGAQSVTPASHYAPGTWMRDSFWTDMGLTGWQPEAQTEATILNHYTQAIPVSGPDAGQVPLITGLPGACCTFADESGLLYLIRMYRDKDVLDLPVSDPSTARLVLAYVIAHQTSDGKFLTAAPQDWNGYPFSPDSWLDGYGYPQGAVDAYDQGLYVVALEAAQRLGLGVTSADIAAADKQYQALYDPSLGYMRWLSTTTNKSPDVLTGDALSLYLFGRPLLPARVVSSTLAAQTWTPYGMKDLATSTGGYVPASEFLNTTNNGIAAEPAGWYQNGGSWFLYEYLAEYAAARQGDPVAYRLMQRSVAAEIAATPMLKEFKLTAADPALTPAVDGNYPYPLGTTALPRQGYGWNAAYVAFALTLPPSRG
jgi:hypothetical protein